MVLVVTMKRISIKTLTNTMREKSYFIFFLGIFRAKYLPPVVVGLRVVGLEAINKRNSDANT